MLSQSRLLVTSATRATHVETVSAGVVCMAKTPPFFLVLLAVKLHGAGSLNFTVPLVHDLEHSCCALTSVQALERLGLQGPYGH